MYLSISQMILVYLKMNASQKQTSIEKMKPSFISLWFISVWQICRGHKPTSVTLFLNCTIWSTYTKCTNTYMAIYAVQKLLFTLRKISICTPPSLETNSMYFWFQTLLRHSAYLQLATGQICCATLVSLSRVIHLCFYPMLTHPVSLSLE